ncbi:hypothetical protein BsWGS_10444 [Bradybaena similaris]
MAIRFLSNQMHWFLAIIVITALNLPRGAQARAPTSLDCNPSQAKMSCLLGCFGCFEAFGVELYDMAACCRACRLTNANIIDEGPARCSREYVRRSWIKRIG